MREINCACVGVGLLFFMALGCAKKDNGAPCETGSECSSSQCIGAICCSAACDGACEACTSAKTGKPDGTCAPVPAGPVCRAQAGVCDVEETCNGTSGQCPSDAKEPTTKQCRAAAGPCDDADFCDGASTACADRLKPSTSVCRAAVGGCDAVERCTGTSPMCPSDVLMASGAVCRASDGGCDLAEVCNGATTQCPADVYAAAGLSCRPPVGACDVEETCSGSTAACPDDQLVAQDTTCRAAAGVCDVAERCTGSTGLCPADGLKQANTECRAALGPCDVAETCTGVAPSCPTDQLAASTTECRASAGPCDAPELCLGNSPTCPNDTKLSASTRCGVSTGPCDRDDYCDGTNNGCFDALLDAGVASTCGGYLCRGTSAACPTSCNAQGQCASHNACLASACVAVKRAFVTSTQYGGGLGGIDGGDTKCQAHANAANLPGAFAAWLSDGILARTPSVRFTQFAGPYVLVDGTKIANNWADIVDGSLIAPLNKTQLGGAPASSTTWTATNPQGGIPGFINSNAHCSGWSTDAGSGQLTGMGMAGVSYIESGNWSLNSTQGCNQPAHLYCFEQ